MKRFWKEGELVATTREPSDRLPMFLADRLCHRAHDSQTEQTDASAPRGRADLPVISDRLVDDDCATEFIQTKDAFGMTLSALHDSGEEPDA